MLAGHYLTCTLNLQRYHMLAKLHQHETVTFTHHHVKEGMHTIYQILHRYIPAHDDGCHIKAGNFWRIMSCISRPV